MKAHEIRQMTTQEIEQRIRDEEENLTMMRFQLATGQLTNTSKLKLTRNDIARMKTVLTERKLAEGITA